MVEAGYSKEWLIYAPQTTTSNLTTFNTTAAEYYVLPAITSNVTQNYSVDEERELGYSRGRGGHELGSFAPSGSFDTKLYTENFLRLFLTMMTDYVKQTDVPSSSNYTYGLLYDDTVGLGHVSMQQIYRDITQFPTNAIGLSILAAIIQNYTLSAEVGNPVKLNVSWLAKDAAISTDDSAGDGKYWTYGAGTTNTPNVIATASAIAAPSARPLWFFDGAMYYDSDVGSTITFNPTTQVSSFASMDTLSRVESFSMDVSHGIDEDGFELGSDRTRAYFCPGNRDINLNLTLSWCDRSTTLYELARAGSPIPMQLSLVRSSTRAVYLYFPAVFIDPFDLPDISGDKSKRTFDVTGRAEVAAVTNTTTGTTSYDLNMVWVNGESI